LTLVQKVQKSETRSEDICYIRYIHIIAVQIPCIPHGLVCGGGDIGGGPSSGALGSGPGVDVLEGPGAPGERNTYGPDGEKSHQAAGGGICPRGLAKATVWASL